MATILSIVRGDVVAACRSPAVASAAGIAIALWKDATTPRVFDGIQGFQGGRNRGRLPFLEVACGGMEMLERSVEGGVSQVTVTIRCHVGTKDQSTAADLTASILLTCLAKIRDMATVTYLADGDDALGDLVAGPWGLMRDATVTIRHNFSADNYGVI